MLFNVFCKVITFKYTQEQRITKTQTSYKVFFTGFQWVTFFNGGIKYKCRTDRCLTIVKHHSMRSTWFSKSSGHNERRRMRERYEYMVCFEQRRKEAIFSFSTMPRRIKA